MISDRLQEFGSKLIDNMDDDIVKPLFMDKDFLGRNVLHLVTTNGYKKLMQDDKLAALLEELWVGTLSYECDGRVNEFSELSRLATSSIKRLPGEQIGVSELLGNSSSVNEGGENYWF
eukprot:CAMPEP_0176394700 /NCGR_PEP_ID=MMETSP0126-20121128/42797_1 /TAXON_ID=141414 ORGANISM="Strombidinopsis acuminatum, Strain SPMC142" /NCGR_SAMPLE_ID=MMETSP0126 /ASSEMBLY_ACC=CAM_ASM_000229 /LENGTH=117 /DNA_ID=CAMNT_0017767093 /DNA_START=171 /DNA_END=524 /DNA_ORIENTATION=-